MSKADKSHNNPKSRKDNFVLTKQEGKGDEAVIRENPDEETVDIIKSKEHSRGRKRHLPSTKGDHPHRSKRANTESSRDKSDCARARAWRKQK